jgi:hypothetical protein
MQPLTFPSVFAEGHFELLIIKHTMKAIYKMTFLLILGSFALPAFAQEQQANVQGQTAVAPGSENPDKADPIARDPRISEETWQLMQHAGEDNPAKAQAVARDPKMSDADWKRVQTAGEDNPDKAQPVDPPNLRERQDIQATQSGESAPQIERIPDGTQPAGEVPAQLTDYRTLQGPATQPEGEQPEHMTDYRNLKGPATQPEGDKDR